MASKVPLFFLLHCILTIPLAIQFIGTVSASPFSISQDHCGSLRSCTKGIELTVNTLILSTFLCMLTVTTAGTYVLSKFTVLSCVATYVNAVTADCIMGYM